MSNFEVWNVCGNCGFEDRDGAVAPTVVVGKYPRVKRGSCLECGKTEWVPRFGGESDEVFAERLRRWGYRKEVKKEG